MSANPPVLDHRTAEEIYAQAVELAKYYCRGWASEQWRHGHFDAADPGLVILKLFSHLAADLFEHLNRIPAKHRLAFYDLLGHHPAAPTPAKIPLIFTPAPGTTATLIPAQTQVAHQTNPDIVFSTGEELNVRPTAMPQAIYSLDPWRDKYCDLRSLIVPDKDGKPTEGFALFGGNSKEEPIEHSLWLGDPDIFGAAHPATIALTIEGHDLKTTHFGRVDYQIKGDDDLAENVALSNRSKLSDDGILGVEKVGESITITIKQKQEKLMAEQTRGKFKPLHCRLRPQEEGFDIWGLLPRITTITGSVKTDPFFPDVVLAGDSEVDVIKGFYPFGELPAKHDCLYIASRDAFGKAKAEVTMTLQGFEFPKKDNNSYVWEYWNGTKWMSLTVENYQITVPDDIKIWKLDGKENYWIRLRLTEDEPYGHPGKFMEKDSGNKLYSYQTSTLRAPFITNISLQYTKTKKNLEEIVSCNHFKYEDLKSTTQLRLWIVHRFSVVDDGRKQQIWSGYSTKGVGERKIIGKFIAQIAKDQNITIYYLPNLTSNLSTSINSISEDLKYVIFSNNGKLGHFCYTPPAPRPQIYFGWPPSIAGSNFSLYFDPQPNQPSNASSSFANYEQDLNKLNQRLGRSNQQKELELDSNAPAKEIHWQWYQEKEKWQEFSGVSGDSNLLHPGGLLYLQMPKDITPHEQFGQQLCWLRVTLADGMNFPRRKLRSIYANVCYAENHQVFETITLGSSNGLPGQRFALAHLPVIDLQLEVYEGDAWQSWQQPRYRGEVIGEFSFSTPESRHYLVDHGRGQVIFGDGRHGKIPPIGQNNIRVVRYVQGGGAGGNVAAGEINVLKNAVANIDSVTNLAPVVFGCSAESESDFIQRCRRQTTTFDRAITRGDIEKLAQATRLVSQVKVIKEHNPSRLKVVIVPASPQPHPRADVELCRRVRDFIEQRTFMYWRGKIEVVSVEYYDVGVTVESLQPRQKLTPHERIRLKQNIEQKIRDFFHHAHGGRDGKGQRFDGAKITRSDIFTCLQYFASTLDLSQINIKIELDKETKLEGKLPQPKITVNLK